MNITASTPRALPRSRGERNRARLVVQLVVLLQEPRIVEAEALELLGRRQEVRPELLRCYFHRADMQAGAVRAVLPASSAVPLSIQSAEHGPGPRTLLCHESISCACFVVRSLSAR